jgi:hypothetical protein
VTLERLGSEELLEPNAFVLNPLALGRPAFLLDPGGEDYVGNNSYDDLGRMDE